MSLDESFLALNRILSSFIDSTEAMRNEANREKQTSVLSSSFSTSESNSVMVGRWQKDSQLENNITSLKNHSEALSGSCTKLALVDLSSMPIKGLQSLFDEILKISQGLIASVMVLYGTDLSKPLFDDVHKLSKAELMQVQELAKSIHSGKFDTCKAAIGQVWDLNTVIQKLPLTNKVAYKRSLMGVLKVVKDTHREFDEAKTESLNTPSSSTEEKSDMCEDGWGFDDDNEPFTSDEIPYVDAALSIIEKSFKLIKASIELMSLYSEQTISSLEISETIKPSHLVEIWVAELYLLNSEFSSLITDLGMELYSPLSLDSLKQQYDNVHHAIKKVIKMFEEAREKLAPHITLEEDNVHKLQNTMTGAEELLTSIDLEKACFINV